MSARTPAVRKRKRKLSPPWSRILGGKPIERHIWHFEQKIDLGEENVRRMQFLKMLSLKEYYKIAGGDYGYPAKTVGVAPTDWIPWYELALAIASEFDDSLKIIETPARRKTTRRWRGGPEGSLLLRLVDDYRKTHPQRSLQWCLRLLQKHWPKSYGKMPLRTLGIKYQEAKRYRNAMKRTSS